ncbi:MAG TPA: hypothetical protein VMY69_03490, partial [Phycisphaerae bacterium]|nr:hypothetical protein [Phycisphaerae bacterium]
SGAALELGTAADATKYGAVTFGSAGIHIWTDAIQRAGTGTANAITFGGRMRLGGNYTGTGITPTWTAASTSTRIVATANLTFNGAEVAGANAGYGADLFTNGKTVTWQNINNSTAANKVRIWGGGTVNGNNTNVTAHSGVPSGMGRMGMGL